MLLLGVLLVVVGAVLIALGVLGTAAQWILYLGIGLVAIAVILIVVTRIAGRSNREL